MRLVDVKYMLVRKPVEIESYALNDAEYLSDLGLRFDSGFTFIEAGTGLGKTEQALGYKDDTKHINLAVPLVSMLVNKQGSKHADVPAYYEHGKKDYGDRFGIGALVGTTTMGTYDSHTTMGDELMSKSIVFYDELTYGSASQGFRERVAPQFQRLRNNAHALIAMSGTVYRQAIIPFVDRYIAVSKTLSQKRMATIVVNKKNMPPIEFMRKAIRDGYNKDRLIVAFVESTKIYIN